jgi:hypothetical protein
MTIRLAILTISDATAELTQPNFQLSFWTHVIADRGDRLECGTEEPRVFGSQVFEFDHNRVESIPTGRTPPIAVAWKHTFETTPETGAADPLPYSVFELGPSSATGIVLALSFEGQRTEHCIVITARDLRTDLEYSQELCSEPGPTTAISNSDAIAFCRFEDLPPGDEYRERWCCAHEPARECLSNVEGTAGAPAMAAAPGNTEATRQPPTADDDQESAHHTSQACALTAPPQPTASNAAALWSCALLLAARLRRRKQGR